MIKMPDNDLAYDYETFFHLTVNTSRMGKFLAHYEAYKMIRNIPGALVECGVFKGTSFARFAQFRSLLDNQESMKIIGFDVFNDETPTTAFEEDQEFRDHWIETAGPSSIGVEQLESVFDDMKISNFELIAGDAVVTVPEYARTHPELRIALLNVDIDYVEPTMAVMETFYDRVMPGGVILLDNYAAYHGDTKGIDDFLKIRDAKILRFPFAARPAYIIKT
jgi:hypothetical protein